MEPRNTRKDVGWNWVLKPRNTRNARKGLEEMGLLFEEESFAIRGAIYEVYKNLGTGFLEAVYQEALELEFLESGIPFLVTLLVMVMSLKGSLITGFELVIKAPLVLCDYLLGEIVV